VSLGTKERKGFSQIPHCLIDSGFLKVLKLNELKVYLTLKSHENYGEDSDGTCFPGLERISQLSGINKRLISKITDALVKKGLIQKTQEGKKIIYKLKELSYSYIHSVLRTIPKRKSKRRTPPRNNKTGRFISVPKNMEQLPHQIIQKINPKNMDDINPYFTESINPKNMDTKENKEREIYKDNNALTGVSNETPNFKSHNKKKEQKLSLKQIHPKILESTIKRVGLNEYKKFLRDEGYLEEEIETLKGGS